MDLPKEIVDAVVAKAKEMEFGNITLSISGVGNEKVVDLITETRERFKINNADAEKKLYSALKRG